MGGWGGGGMGEISSGFQSVLVASLLRRDAKMKKRGQEGKSYASELPAAAKFI